MRKSIKLICVLLAFSSMSLRAKDFGLVLDQTASYDGDKFDYKGILIPRFSALIGKNGGIYISLGANIQIDPFTVVPEILRTDFYWRQGGGEFRFGRMQYSDPLGFVANGLFDGLRFSYDTNSAGSFSAGAWYTGFLYKKRTNITMTPNELSSNSEDLDYSDFFNTYFAPKRVLAALDWEHPSLAELLRLKLSLLGQLDLSADEFKKGLHSQYFAGKLTLPLGIFFFDLGGCLELTEQSDEIKMSIAGEFGASLPFPTPFDDRLSFVGRFSSGVPEGDTIIEAFNPLTTITQGEVIEARLSGLSILTLAYNARFHRTFSLGLSASYFILSDLGGTCAVLGNEGWFGGCEFYGRAAWSPVSDIQLNLGGGVFLPKLGNAAPDGDIKWKIELNFILSLY